MKSLPSAAALPIKGRFVRVAVAATSKQRNDALRFQAAGDRDDVPNGVVGMRVVDRHQERLPFVDPLESARHGGALRYAAAIKTGSIPKDTPQQKAQRML